MQKILITGAAGKTGLAITQAVAARGAFACVLVRREAQAAVAQAHGASSVIVGDMEDAATLRLALADCHAVYHICPNMHPQEEAMAERLLAAAREMGVRHIVYHSVLHPQAEAMPHHWRKMRVEEQLFTRGIPFTILQPCAYMQNIRGGWAGIEAEGVYRVPYPVTTRLSLVHLADVADVAARVLTQPGHEGAIYELVGTPGLAQTDVAAALSRALGRVVRAVELPLVDWEARARASGLRGYALDTLRQMFRYYADYGMVGNPAVLTMLLGRAPTSLDAYCAELAARREE
ncbi:MAG: NmrA family NAD(P)-binding protein [Ardenticatenales bacterium]|nr:NmrA family NAD(P)-binding protein [Ardenticatenales bacterium]